MTMVLGPVPGMVQITLGRFGVGLLNLEPVRRTLSRFREELAEALDAIFIACGNQSNALLHDVKAEAKENDFLGIAGRVAGEDQ